jgi:hypothetical protein
MLFFNNKHRQLVWRELGVTVMEICHKHSTVDTFTLFETFWPKTEIENAEPLNSFTLVSAITI